MMFRFAAAIAALALAAPAASAQAIPNAAAIINGFTAADLASVAADLGYASQSIVSDNGAAGLSITTPEGYQFFVAPTVCTPKCLGLDIVAFFGPSSATTLTAANDFNASLSLAKTFIASDTIILSRYVIADYGTARGNVGAEFTNFIGLAVRYASYLSGNPNTISDKVAPGAVAAKPPVSSVSLSAPAAQGLEASPFAAALIAAGEAVPFKK